MGHRWSHHNLILLCELAGHSAHLDDGHGPAERQDQCHLQEHTKGISDSIDMKFLKTFCAVPTHEQKALTHGSFGCQPERGDITHPISKMLKAFLNGNRVGTHRTLTSDSDNV